MSSLKRTQRVGINLTPEQHEQLKQAAQRLNQTPTRYAYEQVICALESRALTPLTAPKNAPSWENQLGELYGIFEVLTQSLDQPFELAESCSPEGTLQPLLKEVNQQVAQAQEMLLSIRSLLVQDLA